MIFGTNSNYMLKYEKSKSKLVEFSIDKENYPHYPLNPDDLTYTTLFILSRYCEELIDNPNSPKIPVLKTELVSVSQYYDSTVKTGLRKEHSNLFLLLGSTSYFLSENFGSAKVLLKNIKNWKIKSNVTTMLYITLQFLLTGERMKLQSSNQDFQLYINNLKNHFETGTSSNSIIEILRKIRHKVYNSTNIMDVSYIDFLFSVVLCAIEHSAWILLPKYSPVSLEYWAEYLKRPNSLKLLWPAQKVIIQSGILNGKDLVVPLPTGVGKTKSIEILLRSIFISNCSSIAVIIAPLRALCNEITTDLTTIFSEEAIINQFSDTVQKDFDLNLISGKNYIFICTPEKFSYIIRHEPDFLSKVSVFIFDEAHLFDDVSRGAQYELLISEISRSRNELAQMVLFSAVLANSHQISEWLFGNKSAIIDSTLVSSTEKSIGFLSSDQTIHYYDKDNMSSESFYVPKSIKISNLQLFGKERKPRLFPENTPQDIAIYYSNKLCPQGSVAIYVGLTKSISSIMKRIISINNRGYDFSNLITAGNNTEAIKLSELFALHYGNDSEFAQAAKIGIFPHYANLPTGVKLAVEHALRKKHVTCVVCTSTLAEGVNIPIKYLFLTSFSIGTTSIQIRKIQNLVGRTARSGIHTEGSTLITDSKFYDNRLTKKVGGHYKWNNCKKMFDFNHTEACSSEILALVSNMYIDYKTYYPANDLSMFIILNYQNDSCFDDFYNDLLKEYKATVDDIRYNRYEPEIGSKISQLKHIIENIENYLCYIFIEQNNETTFTKTAEELVKHTFAYYLGNPEQKQSLITIFRLIAKKIIFKLDAEKMIYYSKSLYGIDTSNKIFNWVIKNIDDLKEYSNDQLLISITDLFVKLFPQLSIVKTDELITIARLWISGEPYISIYNKLLGKLSIRQVEKLCSSTLSYHLCFLIGNIIDAIGNQSDKLSEQLALIQKMLRYGVPSFFQILICENLFDDRILAKQIDNILGNLPINEKNLKTYMQLNQKNISQILQKYPDYFIYKFISFIRTI